MRGFAAILRREIVSRSPLFAVSLAMGGLVAALPWVLRRGQANAEDLRGAAAIGVALLWTTLLALGIGATTLARDAAERRLAFDFARPAGGAAIWLGRLAGAWLTVVAAGALVLALPALAGFDLRSASAGFDTLIQDLAARAGQGEILPRHLLLWSPLVLTGLLAGANLAGLASHGRRGWLAIDLASLALLAGFGWWGWNLLRLWNADAFAEEFFRALAVAVVLVLLVATARQATVGRSEIDRAQREHSRGLAAGAALIVAVGIVTVIAYLRPSPWSVNPGSATVVGLGEKWAFLQGMARGPSPKFRFLVDTERGAWRRLGPASSGFSRWNGDAQRTGDGKTIAWLETRGRDAGPSALHLLRTTDGVTGTGEVAIEWNDLPISWSLSPDGLHVASRWPAEISRSKRPVTRLVVEPLGGGKTTEVQAPDCGGFGPVQLASVRVAHATCDDPRYVILDSEPASTDWGRCELPMPRSGITVHVEAESITSFSGSVFGRQDAVYSTRVHQVIGRTLTLRPREAGSLALFGRFSDDLPHTRIPLPADLAAARLTDGLVFPDGRIVALVETPPSYVTSGRHGRIESALVTPGRNVLLRFDGLGRLEARFELPPGTFRILEYARAEGIVRLLGNRGRVDGETWARFGVQVDLASGAVAPEPGSLSANPARWYDLRPQIAPDGSWVWTDPETRRQRRLLPPPPLSFRWSPTLFSTGRTTSRLADG